MKKCLIILSLVFLFSDSVNAQDISQEHQFDSDIQCLFSDKVRVFQTKAEMSSRLDLKNMAEKNGEYSEGCSQLEGVPSKQFIVGGECDGYLFVAYNRGGIFLQRQLDFYDSRTTESKKPVATYYFELHYKEILDFESLKRAIESGKIKHKSENKENHSKKQSLPK